MQEKGNNFFWPSYVDLLTAIFAIVLVLFVLSFKLFKDKQRQSEDRQHRLEVMAAQYQRIQEIDKQIHALDKSGTFIYDSVYKRFLVKRFVGQEIFNSKSDVIKDKYKPIAVQAGREIEQLIGSFAESKDISFVVLIEGNTAKKDDGEPEGSINGNYFLSYRRSLALQELWQENAIGFGNRTEVILSGSGIYGVGRDSVEENNKRFLIQVIPKIKK